MARGLNFRVYKVEGFYYLCSENKGSFAVTANANLLMMQLILCDNQDNVLLISPKKLSYVYMHLVIGPRCSISIEYLHCMLLWRTGENLLLSTSIAQWLEPRPSDLSVVGWSPGWGGHVPAILRSRISWQIKAMPGTSFFIEQNL